jgi:hypothetical protein
MGMVLVAFLAACAAAPPPRHDEVSLEPNQVGHELGEPVEVLGIAVLQGDLLALDPAQVTEPLSEALDVGRDARGGAEEEKTDPGDFPCWLRYCGKRRHEETEREGAEESDHAARHRSLLSARTCGGILRATCQRRNPNFAD